MLGLERIRLTLHTGYVNLQQAQVLPCARATFAAAGHCSIKDLVQTRACLLGQIVDIRAAFIFMYVMCAKRT